jgi:hypothetical protein
MKKTILLSALLSHAALAQQNETVTINPGYTHQAFYSLANGTVLTPVNTDWDLAFQISGFEASILINSKNNVRLFNAGREASEWNQITSFDTIGYLNPANELLNSDTSWRRGAFNQTNNPADAFDLGWGNYDFATHIVTGDSLYYLRLANGMVKKLQIINLANGTYNFRFADTDGSNEVTASLSKSAFQGKLFGYYSIVNQTTLDREPLKNDFDLVFTQYMAVFPLTYKVTGVLQNDSVPAVKVYPVDVAAAVTNGQNYSYRINTIGYDWKTFDLNNNQWVIEDSLVYFLKDRNGNYWKLWFTGFGGSANGNFYFTKEQVTPLGITQVQPLQIVSVYPNPACSFLNLVVDALNDTGVQLTLTDLSGRIVKEEKHMSHAGLNHYQINTGMLQSGMYLVQLAAEGKVSILKVMKE